MARSQHGTLAHRSFTPFPYFVQICSQNLSKIRNTQNNTPCLDKTNPKKSFKLLQMESFGKCCDLIWKLIEDRLSVLHDLNNF